MVSNFILDSSYCYIRLLGFKILNIMDIRWLVLVHGATSSCIRSFAKLRDLNSKYDDSGILDLKEQGSVKRLCDDKFFCHILSYIPQGTNVHP